MTTLHPSTQRQRALRGRLLVVGGTPAARDFCAAARKLLPAVSESANLYLALADVAASTAREPIAAIAVTSDTEGFDAEMVTQAFHQTDSSIPVVLLYPASDLDIQMDAAAAGYEDMIPLPASAADMTRVFTEIGLIEPPQDRSAEPAPPTKRNPPGTIPAQQRVVEMQIQKAFAQLHPEREQEGSAPTDGARTAPERGAPARPTAIVTDRRDDGDPSPSVPPRGGREADPRGADRRNTRRRNDEVAPDAASGAAQTPRPAPAGDHAPPTDITLVRAILSGEPLLPRAIESIRHYAATDDVRLAAPDRPGEESAIAAERASLRTARVSGNRSDYGTLLSGTVAPEALAHWAAWLAEWLDLERAHMEVHRLAWTDELTGAGNRRALFDFAPRALAQAEHERREVSLMFLDIDDFKQYNDRYGHEAGDEILRETVAVMRECIRPGDQLFRLGGDEFVILFCDPDSGLVRDGVPESVPAIAERCRQKLASTRAPIELLGREGAGAITLSAGCAVFPWHGLTLEELLRKADQRALQAKRDGKDQINFGPDPDVSGSGGSSDPSPRR